MKNLLTTSAIIFLSASLLCCSEERVISGSGTGGDEPDYDIVIPDLSIDIELNYGQTAYIESEELYITFRDVRESRCPADVVCFWEGQGVTELMLLGADGESEEAEPVIQPGRDPDKHTYLKAYALGYSIALEQLLPYPIISDPRPIEEYVATLNVEKLPDAGGCADVLFTMGDIWSKGIDPVSITSASVDGSTLTIDMTYGGGCREHRFALYARPYFMESYPVQIDICLVHDGDDDNCEALIMDSVCFDLRRIGEYYRGLYGNYDDIIVNVHDCLLDDPGEVWSLPYTPE